MEKQFCEMQMTHTGASGLGKLDSFLQFLLNNKGLQVWFFNLGVILLLIM